MERSGTLAEPSDNSTTPYIKKRPTLLGRPLVSANKSELMRQPRLFLAIILSVDIDGHRLLLEQFDQIVVTMFQLELHLFRI